MVVEQGMDDERKVDGEQDVYDEQETMLLTPSIADRMFTYRDGRRYSAQSTTIPLLPNEYAGLW